MNKLHNAIEWARAGWPVLPLSNNAKFPCLKGGHNQATTDFDQINAWPWDGNIGVRPPENVQLIDVDVPIGGKLETTLAWQELHSAFSGWTDWMHGLAQWTPSGGYHLAYKVPLGFQSRQGTDILRTKANDGSAVDLRSDKGYFVVAPSSIGSKAYQLVGAGIVPVANLPELTPFAAAKLGLAQNTQSAAPIPRVSGVTKPQSKTLGRNSIKKWRATLEKALAFGAIDLTGNEGFEVVASTLASAIRDEGHRTADILELFHELCSRFPNYDPAREEGRLLSFVFDEYAGKQRSFGTLIFLIDQAQLSAVASREMAQ